MEPEITCDATYSTLSKKVFRCDVAPHPDKPEKHYFVRDRDAEAERSDQKPGSLVRRPGEWR